MSYLDDIRKASEEQASTKVIADTGDFLDHCNTFLNSMAGWQIPEPSQNIPVTLDQAYHATVRAAVRQVMENLIQSTVMYAANSVNQDEEKRRKRSAIVVVKGEHNGHRH